MVLCNGETVNSLRCSKASIRRCRSEVLGRSRFEAITHSTCCWTSSVDRYHRSLPPIATIVPAQRIQQTPRRNCGPQLALAMTLRSARQSDWAKQWSGSHEARRCIHRTPFDGSCHPTPSQRNLASIAMTPDASNEHSMVSLKSA